MRFALVLAFAACGGGSNPADPDASPPDPDSGVPTDLPPPRETKTSTQSLQAGEVIEAEMIGGTEDRAIIKLSAPVSELDWNIHAHPNGGTVTVHQELNIMMVTYDFVPTEQTEWFLLLRNSGPTNMDVEVEIDLYGAMTFDFL